MKQKDENIDGTNEDFDKNLGIDEFVKLFNETVPYKVPKVVPTTILLSSLGGGSFVMISQDSSKLKAVSEFVYSLFPRALKIDVNEWEDRFLNQEDCLLMINDAHNINSIISDKIISKIDENTPQSFEEALNTDLLKDLKFCLCYDGNNIKKDDFMKLALNVGILLDLDGRINDDKKTNN